MSHDINSEHGVFSYRVKIQLQAMNSTAFYSFENDRYFDVITVDCANEDDAEAKAVARHLNLDLNDIYFADTGLYGYSRGRFDFFAVLSDPF